MLKVINPKQKSFPATQMKAGECCVLIKSEYTDFKKYVGCLIQRTCTSDLKLHFQVVCSADFLCNEQYAAMLQVRRITPKDKITLKAKK